MKLHKEYHKDGITITKSYNHGEKYHNALYWNRNDGKVTHEKLKNMVPDAKLIEIQHRSAFTSDFVPTKSIIVIVERTWVE